MARDKHIYIEIGGRCGNQMFQYAFARALQEKFYHDYDIQMCFKNVEKSGTSKDGWENSLKYFNTSNAHVVESVQLRKVQYVICGAYALLKRILPNVEITMQKLLNKNGIYASRKSHYIETIESNSKVVYCRGRFEAYQYFDFIRDELIKEFTPKEDVLEHNRALMQEIQTTQSVCVTIRRGDFLAEGNSKFNVCDKDYFARAMQKVKEIIPNAKFFVFSDDVEDIKKNFCFPGATVYETGNDPVWEKLRLMYSCKHFIISNSTFSWWAQYLGDYEKKIVFAPLKWREGTEDCSGMYLPYMKFLD